MGTVQFKGISKAYGSLTVVDNVSVEIPSGSLFTLLGPSGCGKTTCLNIVAGFISASAGDICIGGSRINHVPPHKRDTSMVFQGYALFPHLTVAQNVAFGLRMRKVPRHEVGSRVASALDLVQLATHADRYPRHLSGGQQQRVALARSLVVSPQVLLLDEPLSNLDAKLREQMRDEIRRLQQKLGITAVYVTHDQEEALAISDQVVLMNGGRIEQIGPPELIYSRPQNEFVARFIGGANVLDVASLRETEDGIAIRLEADPQVEIVVPAASATVPKPGKLVLRPEHISVDTGFAGVMKARFDYSIFLGIRILGVFTVGGSSVRGTLTEEQRATIRAGDVVGLAIETDKAILVR